MREMKTKKRKKRNPVPAVVSHSSILIISGFLIGISAGQTHAPAIAMSLFLLGVFGIIAYIGLGYLAGQRQERAAERKQQRAARKLEHRMGRHIPRSVSESRLQGNHHESRTEADARLVHSH